MTRRIAWVLITAGVALHVYIDLFLSDRPMSVFGVVGVILWPSLPYILCAVMPKSSACDVLGVASRSSAFPCGRMDETNPQYRQLQPTHGRSTTPSEYSGY